MTRHRLHIVLAATALLLAAAAAVAEVALPPPESRIELIEFDPSAGGCLAY